MPPRPDVLLDKDALADFRRGFCQMAELAAVSYGPLAGMIAHLAELRSEPELLTDAATITRRIIEVPGKAQDMGAMLARHLIWRVREEVGDGSALSALLAKSILAEATRLMAAGFNPQLLRKGMDMAVDSVCSQLDAMAKPLQGEEDFIALATSITGKPALGKILGEAIDLVGADGSVIIEEYTAPYLDREYVDGARVPWGLTSSHFETDRIRHEITLEQPYVFVTSNKLQSTQDILPIINIVKEAGGKSLLVIADQVQNDALATLIVNSQKSEIKCAAVKVEALGQHRVPSMEDIAVLTGGRIILADQGLTSRDVKLEDLGRARQIVARRKETVIAGGAGTPASVRDRIRLIRQQLRQLDLSDDTYKPLRERISYLSSGVAVIKVGAFSAKERGQLKEQIENALLVVSASAEEGMVPGGGAALLACQSGLQKLRLAGDAAYGIEIISRALEEPMKQVARSIGQHPPLAVEAARRRGKGFGLDAHSGKVVDMMAAGVSDPVKVLKRALTSAASAAAMVMTTEALVLHRKPQQMMEP